MNDVAHTADEQALVAWQLGRIPREPWRVSERCRFGFPQAIVSPCRLADGTPFPDFAWLTCPYLRDAASAEESRGAAASWARRAAEEPEIAENLAKVDDAVREARAAESGGFDECAALGAAGQRNPFGVKCVHAHVALQLSGIEDVVGQWLIGIAGDACPDSRCARFPFSSTTEESR